MQLGRIKENLIPVQTKTDAVGFMGGMQNCANLAFAMMQGTFFRRLDGRTLLAGGQPDAEKNMAESRIAAFGEAADMAAVAAVIGDQIQASQCPYLPGMLEAVRIADKGGVAGGGIG